MRKVIAVLDTMWDWQGRTSAAGYDEAPRSFVINPHNFSGKRLYWFLGPQGRYFDCLRVTNACRELGCSAKHHGKGDPVWLTENLECLAPFHLLLVCGRVAQKTYDRALDMMIVPPESRVILMPHPAARTWKRQDLERVRFVIQKGVSDLRIRYSRDGELKIKITKGML